MVSLLTGQVLVSAGFIQASMSKNSRNFQGLLKASNSFQGLNVNENTDLSVKSLLQKC